MSKGKDPKTALADWLKEYLVEVRKEKGDALNEKLEAAFGEGVMLFPLAEALAKRRAADVGPLFRGVLERVAASEHFSLAWEGFVCLGLAELWGDFELSAASRAGEFLGPLWRACCGKDPKKVSPEEETPKKSSPLDAEMIAFAAEQGLDGLDGLLVLPWRAVKARAESAGLSLGVMQALAELFGRDQLDTPEDGKKSVNGKAPKPAKSKPKGQKDGGGGDPLKKRLLNFKGGDGQGGVDSDSGSGSGSASSRDSDRRRRRQRRRGSGKDLVRSFAALSKLVDDPLPLLRAAGSKLTEHDDWPLSSDGFTRVAPELYAKIFMQHRRAEDWAVSWCQAVGQVGTPSGTSMIRYGKMLDLALFFDFQKTGQVFNPLNSAMVEVVCRDVYGLVAAYQEANKDDGKKSKGPNWAARDLYDVAGPSRGSIVLEGLEAQAARRQRRRRSAKAAADSVRGGLPAPQ